VVVFRKKVGGTNSMKKGLIFLLICLILAACSSGKNALSREDLCIAKVGNTETKVCYGMERAAVEKILGAGKTNGGIIEYDSGVSLLYRDDKAAGISLSRGSEKRFQTVRGVEVGMEKSDIKKIYGSKTIIDGKMNLDYMYNSLEQKFITEAEKAPPSEQTLKETNSFSVQFDENGFAERIMLLDRMMAIHLK
jgi:outer membrane protein assembly factor BamE (lipoprotein component of BamABCDE complex)